jgi:hypothetical protein
MDRGHGLTMCGLRNINHDAGPASLPAVNAPDSCAVAVERACTAAVTRLSGCKQMPEAAPDTFRRGVALFPSGQSGDLLGQSLGEHVAAGLWQWRGQQH